MTTTQPQVQENVDEILERFEAEPPDPVLQAFVLVLDRQSVFPSLPSKERAHELFTVLKSETLTDPAHWLKVQIGCPQVYADAIYRRLRMLWLPEKATEEYGVVPAGTMTSGGAPGVDPQMFAALQSEVQKLRAMLTAAEHRPEGADTPAPPLGPPGATGRQASKRRPRE